MFWFFLHSFIQHFVFCSLEYYLCCHSLGINYNGLLQKPGTSPRMGVYLQDIALHASGSSVTVSACALGALKDLCI